MHQSDIEGLNFGENEQNDPIEKVEILSENLQEKIESLTKNVDYYDPKVIRHMIDSIEQRVKNRIPSDEF